MLWTKWHILLSSAWLFRFLDDTCVLTPEKKSQRSIGKIYILTSMTQVQTRAKNMCSTYQMKIRVIVAPLPTHALIPNYVTRRFVRPQWIIHIPAMTPVIPTASSNTSVLFVLPTKSASSANSNHTTLHSSESNIPQKNISEPTQNVLWVKIRWQIWIKS